MIFSSFFLAELSEMSTIKAITKKLNTSQVTPQILFTVYDGEDIELRSKIDAIKPWIESKIKRSARETNNKVAFELFERISDLLRISYVGCHGYSCSTKALHIHSKYQNLMYEVTKSRYEVSVVVHRSFL